MRKLSISLFTNQYHIRNLAQDLSDFYNRYIWGLIFSSVGKNKYMVIQKKQKKTQQFTEFSLDLLEVLFLFFHQLTFAKCTILKRVSPYQYLDMGA